MTRTLDLRLMMALRLVCVVAGVVTVLATARATAQQNRPPAQAAGDSVRVLQVRSNIYMLAAGGSNVTVQIGKQGVLLVDTPNPALATRALAEITKLSPAPIRYVINTSVDGDHAGGNEAIAMSGTPGAGAFLAPTAVASVGTAIGMTILAHENVLNRMTAAPSAGQSPVSRAGLPTSEYFQATKDFFFNGEPIIVYHQPAAHTDGDSIVMFRGSDVVSSGDIFSPQRFPMIDMQRGGSVQGIIEGLNLILSLTVPEAFQEGGTKVIPAHGRLCEEADVVEYRDMVAIVRDRVADLIKKGRSLEQIKAARPTSDYDAEYDSAAVTPDAFVEAVYASLSGKK
jgi:cyclase